MRRPLTTLWLALAMAAGLAAAPALYAQDDQRMPGAPMMGESMTGQSGMMGQMMSGMMSMMGMSGGMTGHCGEMMQGMGDHDHGSARPNEQWRERAPSAPDLRR